MGRSRRRNRELLRMNAEAGPDVRRERLTPTYVSVGSAARDAELDALVLPIEGIQTGEAISGPQLALIEEEMPVDAYLEDSRDPYQLDLTALEAEAAAAEEAQAEPAIDPVETLYAEANDAAAAGRTIDAKKLYKELLDHTPGHIRARNSLARLLERLGDQNGALAEYDRALDIESENITLLTSRGALLGAMGRYAAAERDLKRVLRADPAHIEALFHLGVVMTRKGLWAEAVEHLRRAVELDPTRGQSHYYLGEALNHVDNLAGAMSAYLRAAELMPENPRALYGLGIVYDRMGRPDDAAKMYRKSREIGRR